MLLAKGFLVVILAVPFAAVAENVGRLPVVDLGYEVYRAASFNVSYPSIEIV